MIDFNNYKQQDKFKNVTSKVAEYYKGSLYTNEKDVNNTEIKTIQTRGQTAKLTEQFHKNKDDEKDYKNNTIKSAKAISTR